MSAAEIESETPTPSSSSSSSNSTTTTVNTPTIGLLLSNTESIRSFLNLSSSSSSNLSENLRKSALSLSSQSSIPYQSLRSIWASSDSTTRPSLSLLLRGSSFLFTSPEPREKSEELKARLRKLEELAERKAYAELVKDITPKKPNEPFSSYKDQLGFGLHVVVIMFTGFLFGYFAFNALFDHNPVMSTAGGILGLVFGMLVETLLFIIRTNDFSDKSPSSHSPSNLTIKKNQ
ncbi:hypothetical protein SOVF_113840 [Spinacia oleracea]|uniref:Suppressor protein SRP40 n=1 Tax=Spinacia oleracea TaxID=3562 RepID=A0A9R0IQI1_SPIOL|nr:suppressor protein SRP40 [Spinacia oleracea]KNA13713.1 hypothetical protein SOVF_113840 [Spinacia oleracea]